MSGLKVLELKKYMKFSDDGRCVNHLYHSPLSDVLLVCWEPEQISSYHDHGESESIVYVLEGNITVMSHGTTHRFAAGNVVVTPKGVKHQLSNPGTERAKTLHFYAPTLPSPAGSPPLNDFTEQFA